MFCLPPLKISIFQVAALALLTNSLAAAGVQFVAILFETLSIVADVLLVFLPPTYHEGNRSLVGLGSMSPKWIWLRTMKAGAVLTLLGCFQLSGLRSLWAYSIQPF